METENSRNYYTFAVSLNNITFHLRSTRIYVLPESEMDRVLHKHFSMEIHYIFHGQETLLCGKDADPLILKAGECGVIPKGYYHAPAAEHGAERFCFDFSIEFNPKSEHVHTADYSRIHDVYENIREPAVLRDETLTGLMEHYRDFDSGEAGFQHNQRGFLMMTVLMRVMELLWNTLPGSIRREAGERDVLMLNRKWIVEEYVSEKFTQDEGIEGLAKALYLSERQTRNLVQEMFGKSYREIVMQQRMELADILLRTTKNPLSKIASDVGYRSYSGFYLAYLKHYGISPEAARAEEEKNDFESQRKERT